MSMTAASPASDKIRQALRQPAFIVVAAILLVAAVGLNGATQFGQLHFRKAPVDQRQSFSSLPRIMGNWIQISEDEKLEKETQDVLGTDKYIYRDYVNVAYAADYIAAVRSIESKNESGRQGLIKAAEAELIDKSTKERSDAVIAINKDKSLGDRRRAMLLVQGLHPDGVVNMGLTYYTGMVDTVAHIPDRCYIADGYEPSEYTRPLWDVGAGKSLQVRYINFEDQTGTGRVAKNVAYVFHVNGEYKDDPLDVRYTLQNLTQKYGYYAKIELMTIGQARDRSAAAMADFLSAAKPKIEGCLPDWNAVIHKK